MDLSFYIRHILLGLRSSFKGFFIGGANESAQKFWRQTWYWQNGFGRQQALLATVGDTFVWWLLMSFCHQQLCFQQPDIVPIICHQFLSPKTFPFELIYHIQFLYHNTNSVVLPKYYLSIEIIYKISYLKIKGVTNWVTRDCLLRIRQWVMVLKLYSHKLYLGFIQLLYQTSL